MPLRKLRLATRRGFGLRSSLLVTLAPNPEAVKGWLDKHAPPGVIRMKRSRHRIRTASG